MPARLDDQQRLVDLIPRLRRYARALLGSAAAADNLVEETLARAWAKRELYREGTDLRTWVFTFMHNTDLGKMQTLRAIRPIEDPSYGDLERALARLDADQRVVLLLVTLEGMTYDEVASVLGIPQATVIARLSQARNTLRGIGRR